MPIYSIAGDPALCREILMEVSQAAKGREELAQIDIGSEAPANLWNLGEWMFSDGTQHLPSAWVNGTCPKDLKLRQCPTFNVYKALVEQIQGGVLQAMPDLEFEISEATRNGSAQVMASEMLPSPSPSPSPLPSPISPEIPTEALAEAPTEAPTEIGHEVGEIWKEAAERSRLLTELDICIVHNCNYGMGWLGISEDDLGRHCIRAVHPQLVIFDPVAERPEDIKWVAKAIAKRAHKQSIDSVQLDNALWPKSVQNKPESTEVHVEIWIAKGAVFAGRRWEESGGHIVMRGMGRVEFEEDWQFDFVPLIPVYLLPSDGMFGQALSAILYQAQVRVDKILGIILARAARAAGEKWWVARDAARRGAPGAKGVVTTQIATEDLTKPGVQVIFSEAEIRQLATPDHVPEDLFRLFQEAVFDMERLAGISQPYQGMAPRGITAGIAIQTLASMSGRRVNRMAMHLAEALKSLGKLFASLTLAQMGVIASQTKVRVHLTALEEATAHKQLMALNTLKQFGLSIPPEELAALIPGLSTERRERIIAHNVMLQNLMQQAQAAQAAQTGQPQSNVPPEDTGVPSGQGQQLEGGGAFPAPAPTTPYPQELMTALGLPPRQGQ